MTCYWFIFILLPFSMLEKEKLCAYRRISVKNPAIFYLCFINSLFCVRAVGCRVHCIKNEVICQGFLIMFKNRPPIYDISGNPSYVEINFDHYLQLTSLEFRGKAKKKNAVHWYKSYMWSLCGNTKKKPTQVWANLEANSWRLMVSAFHSGVIF